MDDASAIEIVLIDDHVAMRERLEVLLKRGGFKVIGAAASAAEGEAILRERHPDVAVIDLDPPDEGGLRLVRRLLTEMPELRVVIYAGGEDPIELAEALERDVRGFVMKPGSLNELLDALQALRGGPHVDPGSSAAAAHTDMKPILTDRERQIFDLLAGGLTAEAIGRRLGIAPETVRTHVRNGKRRLAARTQTEAVALALERGEIGRP